MNELYVEFYFQVSSSMELDENDAEIALVPDTDKNEAEMVTCPIALFGKFKKWSKILASVLKTPLGHG